MTWPGGSWPTNQCRVLAIDGASGCGKSTLSAALSRLGTAQVVHLDQLYPGWDGLEAGVDLLIRYILIPFSRGESGSIPTWNWVRNQPGPINHLDFCPVLIVDGCGSGARRCAEFLSELIWLEAPAAVRYDRAMARDGDDYRPHWGRWAAAERRHFDQENTAARATIRLVTD